MGSLTTYFVGICTHIQSWEIKPAKHRCVLINGMVPATLDRQELAAHMAVLILNADDLYEQPSIRLPDPGLDNLIFLEFGGALLQISNAKAVPPNGLNYTDAYKSGIPSLTKLTPGLSPLSTRMVTGRNPLLTSCYFDVDSGTFDAGSTPFGSAMAILTSDLDDDQPATITLSSFVWGEGTIKVKSGAKIVVANVGIGPNADSPSDFLLHYRVFEQFPTNPKSPTTLAGGLQVPTSRILGATPADVGPGCSNSNYP
jgi:hypothetical protein